MMDDLLNLDINFLDDDLLSFPLGDDFNPIESRELENILNEIEQSTDDKLFNNNVNTTLLNIKPTITFKNCKLNKKTKIGTSLLAKPPKKLKKDKNSLLMNKSNSLINKMNNMISQATFTSYFYNEHNYCFNPSTFTKIEQTTTEFIDLNNNNSNLDNNDDIPIEFTKEIIINSTDDDELIKINKKNQTLNLISPNMFITNNFETVHDLDDYFNISFTNSIETNSDSLSPLSNTQSESEEDDLHLLVNKENNLVEKEVNECKLEEKIIKEEIKEEIKSDNNDKLEINEKSTELNDEKTNEPIVKHITIDKTIVQKSSTITSSKSINSNTIVKNIIIDDINNYNINDTDNELVSLDEDDEEDDILIDADILIDEIDEMFENFEEYDLISTNKRLKTSKSISNKKINRNVNNKTVKPQINNQRDRRSRTISNSYSTRSGSSCSCCSESEEELLKRPLDDQSKSHQHHQQQHKSINKQRRSISKLIKTDNTFIRKKNNGRFINIIKNTSF